MALPCIPHIIKLMGRGEIHTSLEIMVALIKCILLANIQMLEHSAQKDSLDRWHLELKPRIFIIIQMAQEEILMLCKLSLFLYFSTTSGGLNNPTGMQEYR